MLTSTIGFGQDAAKTRTVELKGRVRDATGSPVPNARVFVTGSTKVVETTTDASGHYKFEDLQCSAPQANGVVTAVAHLQVLAVADGHAIGSSPGQTVCEFAGNFRGFEPQAGMWTFGEPVVANVRLARAQKLRGRIVDAGGKPLVGARVRLLTSNTLLKDAEFQSEKDFVKFDSGRLAYLHEYEKLRDLCSGITGPDGAFELSHTTGNARLLVEIAAPGYPKLHAFALTTSWNPIAFEPKRLILRHGGVLMLPQMAEVKVAVLRGDTGEPLKDVLVFVFDARHEVTTEAITNRDGKVTLAVPSGEKCSLYASPNSGAPYFHAETELVASEKQEPTVLKLERGVPVYLQFLDEKTGVGVKGLRINVDHKDRYRLVYVNGEQVYVRKSSSANGNLRVLLRPGSRLIHVVRAGSEYQAKDKTIEVKAGKPQRVKILVEKSPPKININ